MKTDHLSKESILAVQKMRTQIPALGHVVTPEDAVKMAEIIDAAKSGNLPDPLAGP